MKKLIFKKSLRKTDNFHETLEIFSDGTMEFAIYFYNTEPSILI